MQDVETAAAEGVDTETRIFDAARSVFYDHGFDGARMQEIARRAGINHSMLHYYFRSKARLFDAVFQRAAGELMPRVVAVLRSDLPILEKIERFATTYMDTIAANPQLPAFVVQELRRNPDALRDVARKATDGMFDGFRRQVREAAERGEIRPVDPEHLFASILALCVFPVIARPMLETVFDADADAYDGFLAERRRTVPAFIIQALKP